MNILFTKELARRLGDTAVTANCLEPGPALSRFGRGAGGTLGVVARLVQAAAFLGIAASTAEGARTPIHLAASSDVATVTGRYFRKCKETAAKPISDDLAVARNLWDTSERLCPFNLLQPLLLGCGREHHRNDLPRDIDPFVGRGHR